MCKQNCASSTCFYAHSKDELLPIKCVNHYSSQSCIHGVFECKFSHVDPLPVLPPEISKQTVAIVYKEMWRNIRKRQREFQEKDDNEYGREIEYRVAKRRREEENNPKLRNKRAKEDLENARRNAERYRLATGKDLLHYSHMNV